MNKPLPTQILLKQLLDYNSVTGIFMWKERAGKSGFNTRYAGTIAGYKNILGYYSITFHKKEYYCHRLAWMYVHGIDPGKSEIDHIDRNPCNNAIINLRLASHGENVCNRVKLKTADPGYTILKGVYLVPSGRYAATIRHNRKDFWLGTFDTISEAQDVRNKASIEKHKEYGRMS
jgi:hypothetical protein